MRKNLGEELWSTYIAEREKGILLSDRSLGRTVARNSPEGAVSWGEFLAFHLQSPAQLQQDHVDAVSSLAIHHAPTCVAIDLL